MQPAMFKSKSIRQKKLNNQRSSQSAAALNAASFPAAPTSTVEIHKVDTGYGQL
jgi:hypothetical protein